MYYAMVMEIGDSGEGCADEVCSVGFIVTSFATYAIEQFPAECKVSYKVYCGNISEASLTESVSDRRTIVHCLKVVH